MEVVRVKKGWRQGRTQHHVVYQVVCMDPVIAHIIHRDVLFTSIWELDTGSEESIPRTVYRFVGRWKPLYGATANLPWQPYDP